MQGLLNLAVFAAIKDPVSESPHPKLAKIASDFSQTFIESDRWQQFLKGLGVTLEVAFLALILGLVIGVVIAIIRTIHDQRRGKQKGFGNVILNIANAICQVYLTVIRGTPMMVQLLIMYFVIFASSSNQVLVAILAFGINSGAYVAEIVRAGILAVDKGQMEAGRSLGLNKFQTMRYIIIPQAFKSILPPLGNEFIVLIKETSIVGYVGMSDLTRVANQMTSKLFDVFTPLLGIAFIYFVLTKVLSILLAKLERRLRKSDNR